MPRRKQRQASISSRNRGEQYSYKSVSFFAEQLKNRIPTSASLACFKKGMLSCKLSWQEFFLVSKQTLGGNGQNMPILTLTGSCVSCPLGRICPSYLIALSLIRSFQFVPLVTRQSAYASIDISTGYIFQSAVCRWEQYRTSKN